MSAWTFSASAMNVPRPRQTGTLGHLKGAMCPFPFAVPSGCVGRGLHTSSNLEISWRTRATDVTESTWHEARLTRYLKVTGSS